MRKIILFFLLISFIAFQSLTRAQEAPLETTSAFTDNAFDDTYATVGNSINMEFNFTADVTVTGWLIAGQVATVEKISNTSWAATYVMQDSDEEGPVSVKVLWNDATGNPGTPITQLLNNAVIFFDKTAPIPDLGSGIMENEGSTAQGIVPFKVVFNEPVQNFGIDGIEVTNANAVRTSWEAESPTVYRFNVLANTLGTVTVRVLAEACNNLVGLSNESSILFTFEKVDRQVNAGSDKVICNNETQLAASLPTGATGSWELIEGDLTIDNPNLPNANVTNIQPGDHILRWNVTYLTNETDFAEITITNNSPYPVDAGPDQTVDEAFATLSAAAPISGTGAWSSGISQLSFQDPANKNTIVSNLGVGNNKMKWKVTNENCSAYDEVIITRNAPCELEGSFEITSTPTNCITYDITSTISNGGKLYSVEWNMGDGTTYRNKASFSHAFKVTAQASSFNVTMTVKDPANSECVLVQTKSVDVPLLESSITATSDELSANLTVNVPESDNFYVNSWSFGDGRNNYSGNSSVNHVYDIGGSYKVCVSGYDIETMCYFFSCTTVKIENSIKPNIGGIKNQTIREGKTFEDVLLDNIVIDGDDPESDLTWEVEGGEELAASIDPSTRILHVEIPNEDWFGMEKFKLTVTDPAGNEDSAPIWFTVVNVNDPPIITGQSDNLFTPLNTSIAITFADIQVTDVDDDYPNGFTMKVHYGKNYKLDKKVVTPKTDYSGELIVPVTVSDGKETSEIFYLSIGSYESIAHAGNDQEICSDEATMDALDPPSTYTGEWTIVLGSANFADPTDPNTLVTELGQGVNKLLWTVTNGSETKSDEVNIVNNTPSPAITAEDTILCGDFVTLRAEKPKFGWGYWSGGTPSVVNKISNNISDVTGLVDGENIFVWTVKQGNCMVSDELKVTAIIANAGEDQLFYSTSTSPITKTNLKAIPTFIPGTAHWASNSIGAMISDQNDPNTHVSNLTVGNNTFTWVVETEYCTSTDDVLISSGYSYVTNGDNVKWDNPDDWNPPGVPAENDSVTLADCVTKISNTGALVDKITIGGNSILEIEATDGKSSGLVVQSLDIAPTADKKSYYGNKKASSASLRIKPGGSLTIGQEAEKGSSASNSLRIKPGGSLVIGQEAEKTSDVYDKGSSASLRIKPGGSLTIGQEAEKGGEKAASASLRIKPGGSLTIGQEAEKSDEEEIVPNSLIVTTGGEVIIGEETEEDIVKSKAKGSSSSLRIRPGGSLTIGQEAEKSSKGSSSSLRIRPGGSLTIGQEAEKGAKGSSSSLRIRPGGSLTIGQEAEKGILDEEAEIIINDDEDFVIEEGADFVIENGGNAYVGTSGDGTTGDASNMVLAEGATMQIKSGGNLFLENEEDFQSSLIMETGSSLIDENQTTAINGNVRVKNLVRGGKRYIVSSPMKEAATEAFLGASLSSFEESASNWSDLQIGEKLGVMKGYFMEFPSDDELVEFTGNLNAGRQKMLGLSFNNSESVNKRGWHLIGNPYSSGICWDSLDGWNRVNIGHTLYQFDGNNYTYYLGKNSPYPISLNNGNGIIKPMRGFFIRANTLGLVEMDYQAQVHIPRLEIQQESKESEENMLKLVAEGNGYLDETVVRYIDDAIVEFDPDIDAFKRITSDESVPQIYTVTPNGAKLAINSLPFTDVTHKVLGLAFVVGTAGEFTINVSSMDIGADTSIYLKDIKENVMVNLEEEQSYTFDYDPSDDENRFEIHLNPYIDPGSSGTGLEYYYSNKEEVNIWAYDNIVEVKTNNIDVSSAKIAVFDITGREVIQKPFDGSSQMKVQLNSPTGNYVVKVYTNEKVYSRKIFIR